jgi:hypothetical protein
LAGDAIIGIAEHEAKKQNCWGTPETEVLFDAEQVKVTCC